MSLVDSDPKIIARVYPDFVARAQGSEHLLRRLIFLDETTAQLELTPHDRSLQKMVSMMTDEVVAAELLVQNGYEYV